MCHIAYNYLSYDFRKPTMTAEKLIITLEKSTVISERQTMTPEKLIMTPEKSTMISEKPTMTSEKLIMTLEKQIMTTETHYGNRIHFEREIDDWESTQRDYHLYYDPRKMYTRVDDEEPTLRRPDQLIYKLITQDNKITI